MLALRDFAMEKWLCLGSLIVAGLLMLVFLLDLIASFPFGGGVFLTVDIAALIASGIILYLSWNAYRDVR